MTPKRCQGKSASIAEKVPEPAEKNGESCPIPTEWANCPRSEGVFAASAEDDHQLALEAAARLNRLQDLPERPAEHLLV